jgi:hypothetical protein
MVNNNRIGKFLSLFLCSSLVFSFLFLKRAEAGFIFEIFGINRDRQEVFENDDWDSVFNFGSEVWTTKNPVSVGKNYSLDDNSNFSINFERLEQPEKIEVATIDVSNKLRLYSRKAYKINTEMINESFSYTLRLPYIDVDNDGKLEDKDGTDVSSLDVYFISDENFNGSFDSALFEKASDKEGVSLNIDRENKIIEVSGLDHFTIFVVSGSSNWQTWEEGSCIEPIEEDGDPNGRCFATMEEALEVASPGDVINYDFDSSLVVMDYAYEKNKENANIGSLNKDAQCGISTNERYKNQEGLHNEVIEFTNIPEASEYRILTLKMEEGEWRPIAGQSMEDESTWRRISAQEMSFGFNSFTEIDDNGTPRIDDDIFRFVALGLSEGLYTNKITAYKDDVKVGITKLDLNEDSDNCSVLIDSSEPLIENEKLTDEFDEAITNVSAGSTVKFKAKVVDSFSEIDYVKALLYDETLTDQVAEIDLTRQSQEAVDDYFSGEFTVFNPGFNRVRWKIVAKDKASNLNSNETYYDLIIDGDASIIASPTPVGVNFDGLSADPFSRPVDFRCVNSEQINTNKNGFVFHWSLVSNARYIVAVETPNNLKYVIGGEEKVFVSDLDDLSFIEDNLDLSYDNINSTSLQYFSEERGLYSLRTRAFIDLNENLKYDEGEPISPWSGACDVMYDEYEPFVDVGSDRTESSVFSQSSNVLDSHSGVGSFLWQKISGPGEVFFSKPNDQETDIFANAPGDYLIRLTVHDNAGNMGFDEFLLNWNADFSDDLIEMGFETFETGALDGVGSCNLSTSDDSYNPPINNQAKMVLKFKDTNNATKYLLSRYRWNEDRWEVYGINRVLVDKNNSYIDPNLSFDEGSQIWILEEGSMANNIFTYHIEALDGAFNLISKTAFNPSDNIDDKEGACKFIVDRYYPYVNAGGNRVADSEFLQDATVIDSHSGIASYEWSKISGPGEVFFGSPNSEDTTVMVDEVGIYVIRLTAYDNAGNFAYDEFTLNWDTAPPVITVDKLITNDSTPELTGTVNKSNAEVKITVNNKEYDAINNGDGTWILPNDVIDELETGVYDVTAKAIGFAGSIGIDGGLAELTVDLVPPEVDAGENKFGRFIMQQNATVVDEDSGVLSYQWSQVSGPGEMIFGSSNQEDTTISATAPGVYVFRLTVHDRAGNVGFDEAVLVWEDFETYSKEPLIEINNGDYKTKKRTVTLNLYPFNSKTVNMMISNNSSFDGAVWEAFAPVKEWSLRGDRGDLKAVYAKFKDSDGAVSGVAINHIYLDEDEDGDEDKDKDEDDDEYEYEYDIDSHIDYGGRSESGSSVDYDDNIDGFRIFDEEIDFTGLDEENDSLKEDGEGSGGSINPDEIAEEPEIQIYKPRSLLASIFWPSSFLGKLIVLLLLIATIVGIYVVTRKMAERED